MRVNVLLIICVVAFAGQKLHAQKDSGFYVETTKFKQYAAKGSSVSTQYRYNAVGWRWLVFTSEQDSIIYAEVTDYDNVGNIIQLVQLPLLRNKKRVNRYDLYGPRGPITYELFTKTIQKIH